MAMVSVLN